MSRRRRGLACAALLLVTACGGSHHSGQAAPKVTASGGPTLTGREVSITALHGHPVVLVFWGTWCGPCRDEQPALNGMYAKWSPRGVDFLGIDLRDSTRQALAFQSQLEVPYASIADSDATLAFTYRIPSAPAIVFLDTRGRVADVVLGALGVMSAAGFDAEITKLLGTPSASA